MTAHRCRLCTANDVDALVEEMADALWERTRDPAVDPAWAKCGPYWQDRFRLHVRTFIGVLQPRR